MSRTNPSQAAMSVDRRRSIAARFLDLFSSVRFGVTLLILLFIYASIGSATFVIRQSRWIERTEFEWFHWWPFDLLIALICVTMTVTTIRRIPLRAVNCGVWMIHIGVITLAVGSVVYFSTKVEGDAPVLRRMIVIERDGQPALRLPALPGNRAVLGSGAEATLIEVRAIDPSWPLRSGADDGAEAYSVMLAVETIEQTFMRQIIDGHPEYTEDLVRTDDPEQPFARARSAQGRRIVDDGLRVSLAPAPQSYFYLAHNITKSWALYLRERGTRAWTQRPIRDLPLYNDYIVHADDVWPSPVAPTFDVDPLDVAVAPGPDDALADVETRIDSYLCYAALETRRVPSARLDPVVTIELEDELGRMKTYDLAAFDRDASAAENGRLRFVWVDNEESRARLHAPAALDVFAPGPEGATVLLVGGPAPETLTVHLHRPGRPPVASPVVVGAPVRLENGIHLTVRRYLAHSEAVTRPSVIAPAQRHPEAREMFSMARVEVSAGGATQFVWARYHHYAFEDLNHALRRYPFRPSLVTLADGRTLEVILSRERRRLPAEVMLDDFEVTAHVGGFSGESSSVRNWTSRVRFAEDDGWSTAQPVSVNAPIEHAGYSFFQAHWDPPAGPRFVGDAPSAGMNYTVLGIGTRHGVAVQLIGCIIAVLGMIYAFYVKPILKRRRPCDDDGAAVARSVPASEEAA